MKSFLLRMFLLAAFAACVSPQDICTASCESQLKDIAFLVDESGSVSNGELIQQKNFLNSLLDCWTISNLAVQVALVTFSTGVTPRFGLTEFNNNRDGAKNFITNFPRTQPPGSTNTDLGIAFIMENIFTGTGGDRPEAPNCLILFTDGDSQNPATITNKQALLPSLSDCFVVGITDNINEAEIDGLASDPKVDHKFLVENYASLPSIQSRLQEVPCPRCTRVCQNSRPCNRSANACECGEIYTGAECQECRF